MVAKVESRLRPPWLETMMAFTPFSTASLPSSAVITPLATRGRSVFEANQLNSSHVTLGLTMPEKAVGASSLDGANPGETFSPS